MLRVVLSLLICISASFCLNNDFTDSFEFGPNVGHVTFTSHGYIGQSEKVLKIPIIVPHCMNMTHVQVDINNRLGPPRVSMDLNTSTVTIRYRSLQYSKSSYAITAKSVPLEKCPHKPKLRII